MDLERKVDPEEEEVVVVVVLLVILRNLRLIKIEDEHDPLI